jgi:hypothetical protein
MACGSGMKAAMLGHGRYRCGGDVTLSRIRMHGRLLPGIDLMPWLRPQLSTVRSPAYGERGFGMRSVVSGVGRKGYGHRRRQRRGAEGLPVIGSLASSAPVFATAHENSRLGCSTLVRSVFDMRHDLSPGCSIGAQLVSDHLLRCDALLPQKAGQQSPGGGGSGRFRQAHTRPD